MNQYNLTESIPNIWHYATGSFALVCLICGAILNGAVIVIFCWNRTLRRPRNYFLINLAITDLGLLLTNNSMHIIASFKRQWPFGQLGCNFYAVCGGVFGLSSIATMATIAIIRLTVVVMPFSSLKLSSSFALKCLICSWLYGSVWILPPLFGWSRFNLEGFGTSCTFDYLSKHRSNRLFLFVLVTGGFLVPLSIILISYTCILWKLVRRGQRFIKRQALEADAFSLRSNQLDFFQSCQNTDFNRNETSGIFSLDENSPVGRHIRRIETRATRTALVVCSLFCLAWTPYSLTTILFQFGFDRWITPYSTALLALFTKTAACVNPLIYALTSSTFRNHLSLYFNRTTTYQAKMPELSSLNQNSSRSREKKEDPSPTPDNFVE